MGLTLDMVKRRLKQYCSRDLTPETFINYYTQFLGEITNIAQIETEPAIIDAEPELVSGMYAFKLPDDFQNEEAVLLSDGGSKITLTKSNVKTFHSKGLYDQIDGHVYTIFNKQLLVPAMYNMKQITLFYNKNLLVEQYSKLFPEDINVTPDLKEIEYPLDAEYVDLALLYISYKFYQTAKQTEIQVMYQEEYLRKKVEYEDRVVAERNASQNNQIITSREYY